MAQRSIEILANESLNKKLSTSARQLVLEKYKIDEIIDRYLDYYKEVQNG